jgi:hypothetical protein
MIGNLYKNLKRLFKMSVGYDTWWQKKQSCTIFVVRNIAPQNKTIKLFNVPIKNQCIYDLLDISYVSEADIRHSLLKGELQRKFQAGEFVVVSSNIDLLQFDKCQLGFLESMGIVDGLQVGSDGYGGLPINFKENISLVGARDGVNRVYTVPAPDKFINGLFQNSQLSISVYHNGKLLEQNIDYVVAESGGVGTGFDLVIFTNYSPPQRSRLLANYQTEIT